MDASQEGRSRIAAPVALIERLDREGHVLQSTLVYQWPVKIGRSFEADIVLDDPHLAPLHAELDEVGGQLHLRVGETVNGAVVGARHLRGGESSPLGAARAMRLGGTRLRVRLASEPMPPERPLARHMLRAAVVPSAPLWKVVLPLLLVTVITALFEQWLDNDPGTPMNSYFSSALTVLAVAMGWSLFWSLGSKLFQGRLEFMSHLKLALVYGLVWTAIDAVLPLLAYAFDASWLSHISGLTGAAVLCALVWAHLGLILPGHRSAVTAGVVALYLTGAGLHLWFNEQRTGRLFSELYATALPPPGWRLASSKPIGALLQDAQGLKKALDEQAKEDKDDDGPEVSEDD